MKSHILLSLLPKYILVWSEGNQNNTTKNNNFKNITFSSKTYFVLLIPKQVQYTQGGGSIPDWEWILAWQK